MIQPSGMARHISAACSAVAASSGSHSPTPLSPSPSIAALAFSPNERGVSNHSWWRRPSATPLRFAVRFTCSHNVCRFQLFPCWPEPVLANVRFSVYKLNGIGIAKRNFHHTQSK